MTKITFYKNNPYSATTRVATHMLVVILALADKGDPKIVLAFAK